MYVLSDMFQGSAELQQWKSALRTIFYPGNFLSDRSELTTLPIHKATFLRAHSVTANDIINFDHPLAQLISDTQDIINYMGVTTSTHDEVTELTNFYEPLTQVLNWAYGIQVTEFSESDNTVTIEGALSDKSEKITLCIYNFRPSELMIKDPTSGILNTLTRDWTQLWLVLGAARKAGNTEPALKLRSKQSPDPDPQQPTDDTGSKKSTGAPESASAAGTSKSARPSSDANPQSIADIEIAGNTSSDQEPGIQIVSEEKAETEDSGRRDFRKPKSEST